MNTHKEIISMILAGGKGTRLGVLTEELAKPAVSYGGKYKLIDFPLSNCVNSGIDTVGVVTQYKANAITDYIGCGKEWNLNNFGEGGVSFLHPHQAGDTENVYKGTANAIYQNEDYIEKYNPKYVLILSGDHIYKMNYKKMLEHHKATGAEATIAVIKVPMEEASRFGILNTSEDTTIESFEEKPKNPKSNLASMGIYIFNWETLKKYLQEDEDDKESSNDFGKDVIPMMLKAKEKMVAFEFEGYWKDVGTIESLWESNMDLLDRGCQLRSNEAWKISCKDAGYDKCKIGFDALVYHSILGENCEINGIVEKSILSKNVKVERGAIIKNSVILENVEIKCNAIIENAIIGENTIIDSETVICKKEGIAVIGANRKVNMYSMNDKGVIH